MIFCVTFMRTTADGVGEDIIHAHCEAPMAEMAIAYAMGEACTHNLDMSGEVWALVSVAVPAKVHAEYERQRCALHGATAPSKHPVDLAAHDGPEEVPLGSHLH